MRFWSSQAAPGESTPSTSLPNLLRLYDYWASGMGNQHLPSVQHSLVDAPKSVSVPEACVCCVRLIVQLLRSTEIRIHHTIFTSKYGMRLSGASLSLVFLPPLGASLFSYLVAAMICTGINDRRLAAARHTICPSSNLDCLHMNV